MEVLIFKTRRAKQASKIIFANYALTYTHSSKKIRSNIEWRCDSQVSTIRKTISISNKDPKLQEIIENVPNYEVSHVIRQLMYDGLKYRHLVEQGVVNDINMPYISQKTTNMHEIEEKSLKTVENEGKEHINDKKERKSLHFDDFNEEIERNSIKIEENEENDEDLKDLLLNNG